MTTLAPPSRYSERRPRLNRTPTVGPLARLVRNAEGKLITKLTDEGRRVLDEWLLDWPAVSKLLHTMHPGRFDAAVKVAGLAEVEAACRHAVTMAMVRFDPAKGYAFTTYAAKCIAKASKDIQYAVRKCVGRTGHLWDSDVKAGGNERHVLRPVDHRTDTLAAALRSETVRTRVSDVLARIDPERRRAFALAHGLEAHPDGQYSTSRASVSRTLGISTDRLNGILAGVWREIGDDLEAVWLEHCEAG